MKPIALTLSTLLLSSLALGWFETKRVDCTRKLLCNGILCTFICESGTVKVDQWIVDSLTFQRKLQWDQPFMKFEMPGTHNSAISQAYGFGIEEDGIEALLHINLYNGDDEGEGVCQYLSLTDQLRIGLRHIEIDIWWGEYVGHGPDIVVCHSPAPGYPVERVEKAAAERNLTLGWDVLKLSCLGTYHTFSSILMEVRTWLDANPDEIVMLYLDTKFPPGPDQAARGNDDLFNAFGSMLFIPNDGNPRVFTPRQLMAMGKRVIVEDHEEGWLHPSHGPAVVFTPDLWDYQFDASRFSQYPNCSIEGDSNWYGKKMVRALDASFTEAATRCAVNIVSGNYQNPDAMQVWSAHLYRQFFVWSWDLAEPRVVNGCPAILPSGRWAALDCSTPLHNVCVGTNDTIWTLSENPTPWMGSRATCPDGYSAGYPTNGYANALLRDAITASTAWLAVPKDLTDALAHKS